MRLEDALTGVKKLAVDTSPIIYYAENLPQYISKMRAVFTRIDAGQITMLTPTITLTEVLAKPYMDGDMKLVEQYQAILENSENVILVPVDTLLATLAAELRARYRWKTPDAVQMAVALHTRCDAFLTNDNAFKKANSEIPVLMLDDLEIGE